MEAKIGKMTEISKIFHFSSLPFVKKYLPLEHILTRKTINNQYYET